MAKTAKTFQYKQTISINREGFTTYVVQDDRLSKKELRVICMLLTHLDSITPKEINMKTIADVLNLKKKDVEEAIVNLIEYEILEQSSSGSVKNGYMFTF
jgi:DNA-binding MarR family transcriptional regulator